MEATQKVVGIYARTSTLKQGESIKTQLKRLRGYCKSHGYDKGNYEIYKEYVDEGLSGATTKREAFESMIEDAKAGKMNMIICTDLDRFTRSLTDLVNALELLQKHDVAFRAVGQGIGTDTKMGGFFLKLFGIAAELERSLSLERLSNGRRRAEKEGKECHRPRIEIPEKKLRELYEEKKLGTKDCGEYFGVSPQTISNRMKEYGIKAREWR